MTYLLVANDGGHVVELRSLVERFDDGHDRAWATAATPQTEALLAGEAVYWVDRAPTRDWRAVITNARHLRRILDDRAFSAVVSTGSSLALSSLPQAALRRIPAHYIESVTRTDTLSLSGKILQQVPGIRMYVQWPQLQTARWHYRGSVLDGYRAIAQPGHPVKRLVVSLGTSSRYGFPRLLRRLVTIVPNDVEVLWQTGSTDVSGLGIDARESVSSFELNDAIASADAVVVHAGAGIALAALAAGKRAVVVPRRAAFHEHVDDHQAEIATALRDRGLAVVAEAHALEWCQVEESASAHVRAERAPSFELA